MPCRSATRHPDLTAHPAQIREWYDSEDGLDLHALDADCAQLRAAAAAADEALRMAARRAGRAWRRRGRASLVRWQPIHRPTLRGRGAVARALRAAVGGLRVAARRPVAAGRREGRAGSVDRRPARRRSGRRGWPRRPPSRVGDRGAEEAVGVVTQQIMPYVDNDIRIEWLTAMRSATASVADAYEDALHQLGGAPAAHFEVPGQLGGPPVSPPARPPVAHAGAQTVPAAAVPAVAPAPLRRPPASEPAPAPELPLSSDSPAAQPLPPALPAQPPAGLDTAQPAGDRQPFPTPSAACPVWWAGSPMRLGALIDGTPDSAAADDVAAIDDPVDQDEGEDTARRRHVADAEETVPEDVPVAEEDVDGEVAVGR